MNKKWYFVINPVSGKSGGLKLWERVKSTLDSNEIDYSFGISNYHRHTIELISESHEQGVRNFIGIGGDGTLNEIVNAIFKIQKVSDASRSTIAQLSVGTGNDWVRNQNKKLDEFNLVERIIADRTTPHDIGLVKTMDSNLVQYFINVAGAGLDGKVVHELEKLSESGKRSKLAYVQSMLQSLTRFEAPESKVYIGSEIIYQGKTLLVAASKGQYFGGGMHISPMATPDSGTLDITLVKKESNLVVFPQLYKLFNGNISSVSFVEKYTKTGTEFITSSPIPVQADGEFVGESKHIKFSVLKHAILVLA